MADLTSDDEAEPEDKSEEVGRRLLITRLIFQVDPYAGENADERRLRLAAAYLESVRKGASDESEVVERIRQESVRICLLPFAFGLCFSYYAYVYASYSDSNSDFASA